MHNMYKGTHARLHSDHERFRMHIYNMRIDIFRNPHESEHADYTRGGSMLKFFVFPCACMQMYVYMLVTAFIVM